MLRFIVFCLSFFAVAPAFAHGGQPSFEEQVGPYIVDIGYDRIGIRPGEEVEFDFDLFTGTGGVADGFADFTHVDIEIAWAGVTTFDTTIENDDVNVPTLRYIFPEEGIYTLHVTYRDGDTQLVYATFEFPVDAHTGAVGRILNILTYVIAAGLVALGAYMIIGSLRR